MTVTYSLVGWFGSHRKVHDGRLSWDAALLLGENWARAGADVEIVQYGSVVHRIGRRNGS